MKLKGVHKNFYKVFVRTSLDPHWATLITSPIQYLPYKSERMSTEGSLVKDKKPVCWSCRLIHGLGIAGIGSYLIFQGKQVKGYHRGTLFIFGGCFTVLGVANLFDIDLFNKSSLN